MAKATGQSAFFNKHRNALLKAHEEHKGDETTFSIGGDLPDGISGGVAQLIECKIKEIEKGKKNAGEYVFYAAGIVVSPKEFKGQRIEGMRTSIVEMLCDTPQSTGKRKTMSDHVAHMYNELRKLGLDTNSLNPQTLEKTLEALAQARPYFRFRTWKGQMQTSGPYANQEPRVQHTWEGACEYSLGDESAVEDNTESVVEEVAPDDSDSDKEVPAGFDETNGDLASLLAAANDGDEAAQGRLQTLALANGAKQREIDKAPDWVAVAELCGYKEDSEDADEGGSSEEPEVEQVCKYRPIDPKTKKPVKEAQDCEVMEVDTKNKTVKLKNLDNIKLVYKSVPWSALE